jgi:hypothetical protein
MLAGVVVGGELGGDHDAVMVWAAQSVEQDAGTMVLVVSGEP